MSLVGHVAQWEREERHTELVGKTEWKRQLGGVIDYCDNIKSSRNWIQKYSHHQHRPTADVSHLISVQPGFPGLY
jgi:hypothetical protein